MTLLKAIKNRKYDQKTLLNLLDKADNVEGCHWSALSYRRTDLEFLDRLFDRPKDGNYNYLHKALRCHIKDPEFLLKLLDGGEIDDCLYLAIRISVDIDSEFMEELLDRTDYVEDLFPDIVNNYELEDEHPFVEELFRKSESLCGYIDLAFEYGYYSKYLISKCCTFRDDFSKMCELGYEEDILELLNETKVGEIEGCLLRALREIEDIEYFLDEMAEKTINFDGCLRAALDRDDISSDFIEVLISKTKNFEGCARGIVDRGLLVECIEETKDTSELLLEALRKGLTLGDEIYTKLLGRAQDVHMCLQYATLNPNGYTEEFLAELARRAESPEDIFDLPDLGGCLALAIKGGYPDEFLQKLYPKTTDFTGVFEAIIAFGGQEKLLCDVFVKEGPWLRHKYIKCIIRGGKYTIEFIEILYDYTYSEKPAVLIELLKQGYYKKDFMTRILNRIGGVEGCLDIAIEKEVYPVDFLMKLVYRTTDLGGILRKALLKNQPVVLLDALLEKGGKANGNGITSPEHKKYCNVFHDNAECFICLIDFEEGAGDTQELPCYHKVHAGCVEGRSLNFKCPYH